MQAAIRSEMHIQVYSLLATLTAHPGSTACLKPLLGIVSRLAVSHKHDFACPFCQHLAQRLLVALLRLEGTPLSSRAHALVGSCRRCRRWPPQDLPDVPTAGV